MATPAVNNLIAFYVLKLLVQPFTKLDAFKLGIIDAHGNNLIPVKDFTTQEQQDAYNYLIRFVINLKRLLMKLPGGDNMTKNLIAAMVLLRENKSENCLVDEARFWQVKQIIDSSVLFVEEQILVEGFLNEDLGMSGVSGIGSDSGSYRSSLGTPMNVAGPTTATDEPAAKPEDVEQYRKKMLRRKKTVAGVQ